MRFVNTKWDKVDDEKRQKNGLQCFKDSPIVFKMYECCQRSVCVHYEIYVNVTFFKTIKFANNCRTSINYEFQYPNGQSTSCYTILIKYCKRILIQKTNSNICRKIRKIDKKQRSVLPNLNFYLWFRYLICKQSCCFSRYNPLYICPNSW